jgi:hypothetical protein
LVATDTKAKDLATGNSTWAIQKMVVTMPDQLYPKCVDWPHHLTARSPHFPLCRFFPGGGSELGLWLPNTRGVLDFWLPNPRTFFYYLQYFCRILDSQLINQRFWRINSQTVGGKKIRGFGRPRTVRRQSSGRPGCLGVD